MIKINGVVIQPPKSLQIDIEDLDGESARNALGELTRDRVAVKRKLNCEWGSLTGSQISTLLQAVQNVFFTVEYPDPLTNSLQSKTMYVGSRNAPVYTWAGGEVKWEGLKMNFIER